ncbi:MAG: diacylglycerol kinase family lipid kinase [Immundisolibacterales bacterium]|nr:diacylglycerol kinase family lipid kinase [Immundisolibacterales bacterium]
MANGDADRPVSETSPGRAGAAPRRRISIIFNPASGRRRRRTLDRVVKALAARKLDVSVAGTSGPGDATRLARCAVSEGTDVVVAAGGDGTIREVVAGMIGCNALLGIVPMGTASVLAAELRLPRRPEVVAGVIAGGTAKALHVPRANGRPFLLMAGAGFDGAVVESVTPSLKRRFGKGAFVLSALRSWAAGPYPRIRVEADGSVRYARWVVVANVSRYAGRYVLAPGADPQAQELAVCLFARARPVAFAWDLLRIVCGGAVRAPGLEILRANDVALSATVRAPVQIDGDAAGSLPLRLESTTERIRVLCP